MKTTRLPNRSAKSLAAFRAAQESGDVRAILETMIPNKEGHTFGTHAISRVKGGAWSFWGRHGLTTETSLDLMVEMLAGVPASKG